MTKVPSHERAGRTVDATELESRLCFSQTPAGLVVPEPIWDGTPDLVCTPHANDAVVVVQLDQPEEWKLRAQNRLQQELVIIDSAVSDREQIIAEFLTRSDGNPVSIFVLDGTRDGVMQISEVLAHFDRVSAVHLFSHGAAGRLQLGNAQLTNETLSQYVSQLTRWQDALTSDADLLIYGCDVAATEDGEELLEAIHVLTSADVAASADLTGNASLGGDWELEFHAGDVQTPVSLGPLFTQTWNYDLSIPPSGEQLVNGNYPNHDISRWQDTNRTDRPSESAVAVANDGRHVAVWTSSGNGGVGDDVFFQLYDTDGTRLGGQFLVNDEFSNSDQNSASVAMDAHGNFVVVWTSQNQDGSNSSVYFRRFDRDGAALASAVRATTAAFSTGEQRDPDIAMNDTGQFAIVWEGEGVGDTEGIFARIFDPTGTAYGEAFLVNSSTSGVQSNPAVGIDGSGNLVVAWNQDSSHIAIQYFGLNGTPGALIDTSTPFYALAGDFQNPSVSVREDGLIAVAYEIKTPFSSDWDVHIQLFKAGLTSPVLNPFPIRSQSTSGDQLNPSVWFSDVDNTVVATWEGNGDVTGHVDDVGVFARRFRVTPQAVGNPMGAPLADEFRVNVTAAANQGAASVAGLDGDNFVVVWSGNGVGDNQGVFLRTVGSTPVTAGDDTASVDEDSPGILIDPRTNDTSGTTLVSVDTTGTRGLVIDNGDGTLTYRPNGQFESLAEGASTTDVFSYTITNGTSTSTATVTVTVLGRNDSPTSANYVSTTNEDAAGYTDNLLALAQDVDHGAVLIVDNPSLISGNSIGVTISASAGTISVDPSRYQYLHRGEQEVIVYNYGIKDEYGATITVSATVTINGRDDDPLAMGDYWGLVPTNLPFTRATSSILANDSDAEADGLMMLDYRQPSHGVLLDLGGSLQYTPNPGYVGADGFDYLLADTHNRPDHYWRLDGSANDTVGSNHGTLFGTTTTAGSFGIGLSFDTSDAIDDYVRLPDESYGADFTISFDFSIDDNNGTGFRYMYSHGAAGAPGSVNVFLREAQNSGTTAPNTLATVVADGNDVVDLNRLDIDASGLVGGWHTYTLTVQSGVGTKVYIDGVLAASSADGADGVDPNTDVYLGAREDLSSTRFFDGRLDSLRVYHRVLDAAEIATVHTIPTSVVGHVGLTVADLPSAHDDTYVLNEDQVLTVTGGASGLLANDTGSGTLTVNTFPLTGPAHGLLNLSSDGSFTYQPHSGYSGLDSFVYSMSSNYGGPSHATVTLSVQANATPIAVDDMATADAGQLITIAAWQNDSDADSGIDFSSYQLVSLPVGATVNNPGDGTFNFRANLPGTYSFGYEFRDMLGKRSNTATVTVTVLPPVLPLLHQVSGTIFEDVNGDGSIADDGVGAAGVTVALYRDNGNGIADNSDIFMGVTTTDASGGYVFDNLAAGVYFVAVDSRTLAPAARLNGGYTASDVWADQTYGAGGSLYYGASSSQQFRTGPGTLFAGSRFGVFDDATTLATSEHVIKVAVNASDVNQRDFGFSFNVVTNLQAGGTEDADGLSNGRTVQGSLRQFIANANAISGGNTMRFVPAEMTPSTAGGLTIRRGLTPTQSGQGGAAWWQLQVTSALPSLTDDFTIIDGTAFNGVDGVSILNPNHNVLGYTGSVGVYDADGIPNSGDEWRLNGIQGPELQLVDGAGLSTGLHLNASDISIRRLAISGFGDATNLLNPFGNIVVGSTSGSLVQRVRILDNVLGSAPDAFAAPSAGSGANLVVLNAAGGLVRGNLIGFADSWGILITPSTPGGGSNWTIESNEIRGNARSSPVVDGIQLGQGSAGVVVQGNLIADHSGSGIDMYMNSASHLIAYNTVAHNGLLGQETSGIRVFGSGSQIRFNQIVNNTGAGVLVMGAASAGGSGPFAGTPALANTISHNQFGGNGGLAIDLLQSSASWTTLNHGDGVSSNDGLLTPTSGNAGLDSPDILAATISGTSLTVSGRATAGGRVEIYQAAPGAGDSLLGVSYGEGLQWLGQAIADAGGNFSLTISSLPATLDVHSQLTAIAIDSSGNTSEFGRNKAVNAAPLAMGDAFTLSEDTTLWATVATNDVDADGDALVYSLVAGPAHGVLNLNPDGTFDFTPHADYHGSDLFTYRADDGNGQWSEASVSLLVTGVNDAPTAAADAFVMVEDTTLISVVGLDDLLLNDIDVDGDTLQVLTTPTIDAANGILVLHADGTFTYTPHTDFCGTDTFVYRVIDGQGGMADATVTITVTSANDDPAATDDLFVASEDATLTVSAANGVLRNDTDADGDSLVVQTTPVTGVGHGTLTLQSDGSFVYVPQANFHGTDAFVYRINDGHGGVATGLVQISVQPVNDAPQAQGDQFSLVRGGSLKVTNASVLDNDVDVDGDALTANLLTGPTHGQITWRADGTFDYVHDGGSDSFDAFMYQVVDASGDVSVATVNLNIQDLDAAPKAVADTFTSLGRLSIANRDTGLLANDVDDHPDSLAATIFTAPAHGTVTLNADGTFLYTPDSLFVGQDEFQYMVTDVSGQSSTTTVHIEVLAPLPPPSAPTDNTSNPTTTSTTETVARTRGEDATTVSSTNAGGNGTGTAPLPGLLAGAPGTQESNELFRGEGETPAAAPVSDEAIITTSNLSVTVDAVADSSANGAFTISRVLDYMRRQPTTVTHQTASMGSTIVPVTTSTLDSLRALLGGQAVQNTLNQLSHDLELSFGVPRVAAAGLVAATSTFTVGYVAWAFRAGYLMASMLTVVPTWQTIDPLPILSYIDDEDEDTAERQESLESLISRSERD